MARDRPRLEALAQAVLDFDSIDWSAGQRNGAHADRWIQHLKVVSVLTATHRQSLGLELDGAHGITSGRWGHLRLLERIGCGAFGEVYRAWDTRLDREVALKLVRAKAGAGSVASSVTREGWLLARVRHPNVVTIHGADQIGEHVGLWMEFVSGHTLEQLLEAGTTFELREVVRIGIELCTALTAVHAAGLLHCDVKAQNVMRAHDGRIVLMDFGSGRELADEESRLTGTPLYLAPELFTGRTASVRSDIYSLGVLLYRLLNGSYPVHGRTVPELRAAHHARGSRLEPLPALRRWPNAKVMLARVIERAIDGQPSGRYASGEALRIALKRILSPRRAGDAMQPSH